MTGQLRVALLAAVTGVVATLSGCSVPDGSVSDDSGAGESSATGSQLTVYAASSLTASFTEIGRQFESTHSGTAVRFNFAGSPALVAQLQQGAPADVLAAADTANMDRVVSAGLVSGAPRGFATNSMTIAVPPDNPAQITDFADLARPGVQLVVCAPEVPCGAATREVEANTGVTLSPVSEESAATDVVNKVATGEADAGVVYVTDVVGSDGSVSGIAIPARDNAVNTYPIAVLADSRESALAMEFAELVVGRQGREVLIDAGFGPS